MEKGQLVTRTLIARDLDAEATDFPFVAQAARLHRQTDKPSSEVVELLTSRPAAQLSPPQWLAATINHWSVENGLHARLDVSRHDDTSRLRRPKAVLIHGMFNRWANSLLIHWRTRTHQTTTDFTSRMAEDHDRRAVSAIVSCTFPS